MDQQAIQKRIEFLLQQTMDRETIEAYRELGEAALPFLIKTLQDLDWDIRRRAAFGLQVLENPQAFEPLLALVQDPERFVREQVAKSLSRLKHPQVFEPLLQLLEDEDLNVRREAISGLTYLKDPQYIPYLVQHLADADDSISYHTAFMLSFFGEQALEPILAFLSQAPKESYPNIIEALKNIGDGKAYSYLIKLLEDPQAHIREQVALALGQFQKKQAALPISALLQDPVPTVRSAAAQALGELKSKRALPTLIDTLADTDTNVRAYAAEALGKIGDKRAVKPLLALADDTSEVDTGNPHTMRSVVIFALSQIGDRQALNTLLTALNDPDADVRWAAAIGLGKIKDPSAIPALRKALDDEEEVSWGGELVSEAAEQALNELKAS